MKQIWIKSNNKTIQSKIMPVAPGSRIKNSIVIRPCYLGTFRTVLLGAIINSKVGPQLNISCILAVVYSQTDTVRPLQHSHYQTVLTSGAAIDTVILYFKSKTYKVTEPSYTKLNNLRKHLRLPATQHIVPSVSAGWRFMQQELTTSDMAGGKKLGVGTVQVGWSP